ncbi:MAG TPA: ATP-dependent helicase HrpB, partial [Methylovirgula sp.]
MDGLTPKLPIDEVLPDICAALSTRTRAVLTAPPGAGKSTRVPLALKDEPWAAGGKILLLEPRRLAARAAADRMATTLGEELGETVGLRMRLLSRVSAKTRIEVVTEGVFTRMILDDPSLQGVAAVFFDEFHERSLDADFGLALALDTSAHLRDDLRLLVMSATLDGARVARLLGEDVRLIESEGRMFPVATHYLGRDPNERIEEALARATLRALAAEPGSVLVFLPGQGEIARLAALLGDKIKDPTVEIMPLYAALDRSAQERAIAPTKPQRRKIVLATSIAETSLTIEGVRIVIDSGLSRVPRYEPDRGLTRLETVRVSRAAADQRRGRAGRLEPGVCYRLWEEAATGALEPFAQPEILQSDLSGFLLDCTAWGARDPARDLAFLDPPPRPALNEARTLLNELGALDEDGALTEEGRAVRKFALPPRLARMLVDAARLGEAELAAEVAVILTERGLGGDSTDLSSRIERFRKDRSQRAEDARRLVKNLQRQAGAQSQTRADAARAGHYLASAFPDRIAIARGKTGHFLLANGRAAHVEPHDALARENFLAVGEIAGRAAAARIVIAAPLTLKDIEDVAGAEITTKDELNFDPTRNAVQARK